MSPSIYGQPGQQQEPTMGNGRPEEGTEKAKTNGNNGERLQMFNRNLISLT